MSIIQGNTKVSAAGYDIPQSIRFNRDDSAYLTKTFSADGGDTWTLSVWIKRGQITTGNNQYWFSEAGGSGIGFVASTDTLRLYNGSTIYNSTPVFRDPSSWYHILFSNNSGTWVCYVNGEAVSGFTGTATLFNRNNAWSIGQYQNGGGNYFDGYMAEINFIDGQALAPTSFGEYNSDTGVWQAVKYAGSYGTNGFYITGENSADLGADYSGNGNNFTSSGLTTADQVTDTPTDNYPVISPIDRQSGASAPLKDGNLVFENNNTGTTVDARATFAVSSGKWYWEVEADALGQSGVAREFVGVVSPVWKIDSGSGGQSFYIDSTGYAYMTTGLKGNNNTTAAYGTAWSAGDIIGVALDLDNGKIWWSRNGTFQNSGDPAAGTGEAYSGLSGTYAPAFAVDYGVATSRLIANFGQTGGLTYTPPTGFSALSTANLSDPAIADPTDHFQTVLDTGTNIKTTAEALYTDQFEWIKDRANANNHQLIDSVRGTSAVLQSNTTAAETTYSAPSGNSVGWVWKANGTGSSNTDGSITSTVSANTTAGFSVVTYTGTGSAATVGHGLNAEPQFIAIKGRTNVDSWGVYPGTSMGYGGQYRLKLNETSPVLASSVYWNNTDATSSVFTVNTDAQVNGSSVNYVAYCFAEVEGFSKMGRYTGNGSADGPFVWCGFRPAFVTVKRTNLADNWVTVDAGRNQYNVANLRLYPDTNNADITSITHDFLSNGFKLRASDGAVNGSGSTYVFMAFAENPFKYSLAR